MGIGHWCTAHQFSTWVATLWHSPAMIAKGDDLLARIRRRRQFRPALARALRQDAGVSQAEIAATLEIDHSTVCKWEGGQRTPRGELADRYFDFLAQLEAVQRPKTEP